MCTAATYTTEDFYFGRTLDYDFSYNDEITITPRRYPLHFYNMGNINSHYAMTGMAYVTENYPLYYEASNEKGLCMAGLNFVGNAVYRNEIRHMCNVAQYEFIPWVLGQCATLQEAKKLLLKTNITNMQFNDKLPVAMLHWMVSDCTGSLTVEPSEDGLEIYDNPIGILTNNPPFHEQMSNLDNYTGLSAKEPADYFPKAMKPGYYSRGMGAAGLPGDLSSQSRFVRAAFTKIHSVSGSSETESVNQFFHILGSVSQTRGCCELGDGQYEITIYTSCCNATKGIYYYTSYGNHQITAIDMHKEDLDCNILISYPVIKEEQIRYQN